MNAIRAAVVLLGILHGAGAPVLAQAQAQEGGAPWKRHTIDSESRGADGVRLADVDADGDLDIATGWEEGGVVRVYRNPGAQEAAGSGPWRAVTVGEVKSAEDAVFADLDGDGAIDVWADTWQSWVRAGRCPGDNESRA